MEMKTGVDQAIEKAGSCGALARLLSTDGDPITVQAIQQWQKKGFVPPPRRPDEPNRILDCEQKTGVHRHFLNPTIYPEQPEQAA